MRSAARPGIYTATVVWGTDMAGNWNQTGRALGSSIANFFAGGDARRQGEMAALQQLQAEQGLELGGLKIEEARADAERKRQEDAIRSPGALRERAMQVFGAPTEAAPDVEAFQRTGRIDKYDTGGMDGPVMPAPAWAAPSNLGKISQFMAAEQAVQGGGAKSVSDYFKAIADQAEAELASATYGGQMDPLEAAKRFYAAKGNAPYSFNEYGVGNNLEGTVDTSGPAATRFAQYRDAQTGAQKANAAQSYAAADASRASATKTRREMAEGGGLGKPPSGYRWTSGGGLEPIKGGPADASTKTGAPTEGERKAATLLKRLEFSEKQLQAAIKNAPGAAKPGYVAEAVRSIPIVGGDTPANVLTGQDRQRVEAAQLDILDAALTLGTGAAYTKEQLRGYARSYFPQIGDDTKTVKDKEARLKNIIDAAYIAAGRAASPPEGAAGAGSQRNIVVDW